MATGSVHRPHDFDYPQSSRPNVAAYNRTGAVAPQYSYTTHQSVGSPDLSHLAHQFSQHTIHYDPRAPTSSYSSATPLQYQQTHHQQPTYYQPPRSHSSYHCPHTSSSTQSQRQANSSLLYQQSHAREISSLVERMVESGEQCLICSPPPPPPDEGLGDMEEDLDDPNLSAHTLGYRRSSDFGSANYVTKSIRVRKQKRPKSDPSRWKQ
jgi:hypothetical protein